jgi:four helix bundle protein
LGEPTINSDRDLQVWQEAMALAEVCYRLTWGLPKEQLFGSTSQIRRSAASIPANIAEGHGRENTGNFVQHLRIAQGSLKELETYLLLAERVELTCAARAGPSLMRAEKLGKMLRSLIRSLQRKGSDA